MTLTGKRVVVTRAPHQAQALADLLRERGANPVRYPCIDIALPDDPTALRRAVREIASYEWLVLTSSNTVEALRREIKTLPSTLRVAAVGPATAEAAASAFGITVAVVPDEHIAEALAETITVQRGARVLLPQSAIAKDTLGDLLRKAGANVTVVDAYQTVIGSGGDDLPAMLYAKEVDAVTFTSSSTVRNCVARIGEACYRMIGLPAVCIGPKTAETAQKHGLARVITAEAYTLPGLVAALERHFTEVNTC